jgi:hypothetical protein
LTKIILKKHKKTKKKDNFGKKNKKAKAKTKTKKNMWGKLKLNSQPAQY